jgi:hypothetical protein
MALTKVTYSMILGAPLNVKDFGAVGDGTTDDTAAIQAALDVSDWTFQTNTVVTESTATPIRVYFPQGTYRITSKLRLAPGLQLSGDDGGIHARTMEQTNLGKKGTTILVDYDNEVDYAIDTSGYAGPNYAGGAFTGQRIDNYPATGSSTASNTYAGCSGMRFENINFQAALGRKVRGMNLGLVPMLVMNNVQVHGFIVGIRIGGCWGGQLSNVRIDGPYGWRPLVLGTDVNNTTLTNVYISGQNSTGSIYTPPVGSVIGDEYWTQYEGIPALYSWMTRADLERSHGIWCRFAAVGAATLTVESTDVGIGLRDSRGDWDAVYMEGITTVLVADYGSGFGAKIDFTDVRSCPTADVLWGIDSFTQMHLPESVQINSVIGGDNVGQWGNPYTATVPVITGIDKKAGETIPSYAFHAYNDGILFTPDSEASTTVSGASTFYNATFGLVTDNREIDGVNWDWRGTRVMRLDGMNSSSPVLQFTGSVTLNSTGDGLTLRNSTYSLSFFAGANPAFFPATDNVISLGRSANRWSVVYAATGTINTSDARDKQQGRSLNDAERAVAVKIKGLLKAFKFNDAVAKKGDKARIHFGVYAQEIAEAFASEGLNAADYAMFCYDEWAATPAEVNPETNEIIHPAQEAGNRFGIRYEELLAFMISAM